MFFIAINLKILFFLPNMDEREVSEALIGAEETCRDCYYELTRNNPPDTVYTSPTPEQRIEIALNFLQSIVNFSDDGQREKAKGAIRACENCLDDDNRPKARSIVEFLQKYH